MMDGGAGHVELARSALRQFGTKPPEGLVAYLVSAGAVCVQADAVKRMLNVHNIICLDEEAQNGRLFAIGLADGEPVFSENIGAMAQYKPGRPMQDGLMLYALRRKQDTPLREVFDLRGNKRPDGFGYHVPEAAPRAGATFTA
jgi:hypothetical protein